MSHTDDARRVELGPDRSIRLHALRFVLLLGLVSLLADMTYEAARSVTGPYLAILGASASAVGAIAGLGECIGYSLRIISGVVSDRTRRYWAVTIVGYAVNLLAVPALALAGNWETAAVLIVTERFGKAIRTPARDAMLSHAAHGLGRGWAFGVHEAMDQVGAAIGPIIVAAVLTWKGSYQYGFAVLAVPAVLALAVLVVARITYPQPQDLEPCFQVGGANAFRSTFWLYLGAVACIALGFVDYPLAAFHIKTTGLVADKWIPLIYAGAMGVDALSALVLGRLYDVRGMWILPVVVAASAERSIRIPVRIRTLDCGNGSVGNRHERAGVDRPCGRRGDRTPRPSSHRIWDFQRGLRSRLVRGKRIDGHFVRPVPDRFGIVLRSNPTSIVAFALLGAQALGEFADGALIHAPADHLPQSKIPVRGSKMR